MKDTFDSLYYYKYLFTGIPKEFAMQSLGIFPDETKHTDTFYN